MGAIQPILYQAAAIAFRVDAGKLQVLLITSRDTGRWLIPKGNIESGSTSRETAAKEAFEEAGVKGTIEGEMPIGVYTYQKRLKDGRCRPAAVETFLLRATGQKGKWQEKKQRNAAWLSLSEAIDRIQEPGVVPLLVRLAELEKHLVDPTGASSDMNVLRFKQG